MRTGRILRRVGLLAVLAGTAGACAGGAGRDAWPTAAALEAAAPEAGRLAALQRGRDLYHGVCTRCHAPVPMDALAPEQWPPALARMSRLSRLEERQERDLADYVAASLRAAAAAREVVPGQP